MDSFELNKIAGAVLFALLILFGTRTLADIIFAVHAPEKPGWEVAIPESTEGPATAEAETVEPIAVRLANASVEKGDSQHKKCTSCHNFEAGAANKIGPALHDVVGSKKAAHEGFAYSDALKSMGGVWTYEDLDHFLENPKKFVPGTKMAFAGVKDPGQRADLILYLRSLQSNPPPLPEPPAPEAKQAEKPAAEGEKPAEGAAPAGEKPAAEGEQKPAAEGDKQPAAEGEKPAEGAAQEQKPVETEDSKTSAPQASEPAQPETVPSNKAEPQDQQTPPVVPTEPNAGKPAQSQ